MYFRKLTFFLVIIFGFDIGLFSSIYLSLPNPKDLIKGVTLIRTASDGKTFSFTVGNKNKKYVNLQDIPKTLQAAVISLEDDRFYEHRGFDFEEILNALRTNLEKGRRLRGASTLSQQLVKNLYLSPVRSFKRKILEALITIKLENTLSKKKILEIYLNSIDWGRGLLGIHDASNFYFKKFPATLDIKESIFLAAIIPNPARFGQLTDEQIPKAFVRRQMMRALQSLFRQGTISLEEFEQTMRETGDEVYAIDRQ